MHNFSKIILKTLLLFIFVVLLLIAFMSPYFYGEKYYYQDYKVRKSLSGEIDTLIVGASQALRAVKPTVLNDNLNVKSYNLSSPLMSMYGRYVLFEKEIQRNPVETVYIELSYDALTRGRKSKWFEGNVYVLGRLDNIGERLNFIRNGFTSNEYKELFSDTIQRSKNSLELAPNEKIVQYETYGYLPKRANDCSLSLEERKKILNTKSIDTTIKQENLKYFNEIIALCEKKDIKVVLFVVPITENVIVKYENIDDIFSQYIELAEKYDCEYYDFNLDKKRFELYSCELSYFDDYHLSDYGAEAFSTRFSEIIKKANEGEDISNEFYKSYEELKKDILKAE